jgi:hypothetical protein
MQCYCGYHEEVSTNAKVLWAPFNPRTIRAFDSDRDQPVGSSQPRLDTPTNFSGLSQALLDNLLAHSDDFPNLVPWLDSQLGGTSGDPTEPPSDDSGIVAQVVSQAQTQGISAAVATDVANQCIRLVENKNDCARIPIWSSGAETPQATKHDLDVITGPEHKPTLVHRQYPVHDRKWTRSVPMCAAIPNTSLENCDEYPLASMEEGGKLNEPSLRVIDADDNQDQGRLLWNNFYRPGMCNIAPGQRFLAIPSATNTPTVGICNQPG